MAFRLFLGKKAAAAPPSSAYRDLVIADGATAYWRLGESSGTTVFDEIASLDGTLNGDDYVMGETGALSGDADTAIRFPVAAVDDSYISIPDNAAIDLGDGPLTYELWFKRVTGTTHSSCFITKGSGTPILIMDDSGAGSIQWYARGTALAVRSSVAVTDTTTWHHLVGTKSNTDVWLLYLDGVDVTASDGGATPSTTSNATEMNLGRDNGGTPGSYLESWLDEVAIYNVVLTPAQVLEHYEVGSGTVSTVDVPPYVGGGYYW